MMGGMSSSGVSLEYIDDEISSYTSIFDNSVFDSTTIDKNRLITAIKNLNSATDLETYVDVKAVLKYFAAHTVVVNLDSYISNMGHNYYLYENDSQITILPWDYNLAFGGFQSSSASSVVNFPIDTPVSGVEMSQRPLLGKLFENEEYLESYHQYLQETINGYFDSNIFEQTVNNIANLIDSYVKNDPTAFYSYEEYTAAIPELIKLGKLRAESIQGQLSGTIPSTTEGQNADSSALIDTSSIQLYTLGSQGGGNFSFGGNMPNMGGNPSGEEGFGGTFPSQMPDFNGEGDFLGKMPDFNTGAGDFPNQNADSKTQSNGFPMGDGDMTWNMDMKNMGAFDGNNNTTFTTEYIIIIAVSFALLIGAIVFTILYKRRKYCVTQ